jgi:lysozyme family protein/peptidoglycan hydrolase-like protein with peptidoglycan-binding domain
MAFELTSALREEYETLFGKLFIRPERQSQIDSIFRRIAQPTARQRYDEVQAATGVPWFLVGIIHNLEASLRFDRHLHNGDPLTAKTVQVPAGRPPGNPPFAWQDSAVDSLKMKNLQDWTDWSLPGIAFVLERFNGTGYRNKHPHVKSPYLWSFSNIYTSGKYVRDGVFSDDAVSEQCGGIVMLRHMIDQDPSIAQRVNFQVAAGGDDAGLPFPHTDGPDGTDPSPPEPTRTDTPPRYPGRYLTNGIEDDSHVKLMQTRLRQLGIETGILDGDFGDVTEFAVRMFQARSSTPNGEPLEVDGVVGPQTWAALFGAESTAQQPGQPAPGTQPTPSAQTLAAIVIEIARREVGIREAPLGSNRGPRVDQYILTTGLNPAAGSTPWCMCFVYWCFKQAAMQLGHATVVPQKGSVHLAWNATRQIGAPVTFVTAAQARRDPSLVQPGMAFFLDTGGGKGHCGIVSANVNAMLETIEGNTTSVSGSREGIGVFQRTRRRVVDGSMMGFASYG